MPNILFQNNYFLNQWYRTYYPHHYDKWKRDNNITYVWKDYSLVKVVNDGHVEQVIDNRPQHDDVDIYLSQSSPIIMTVRGMFMIKRVEIIFYNHGDDFYCRELSENINGMNNTICIVYDLESEKVLKLFILQSNISIAYSYRKEGIHFYRELNSMVVTEEISNTFSVLNDVLETTSVDKISFFSS